MLADVLAENRRFKGFVDDRFVNNFLIARTQNVVGYCCGILLWDFRKCCGMKSSVVGYAEINWYETFLR